MFVISQCISASFFVIDLGSLIKITQNRAKDIITREFFKIFIELNL
jgi:hypothetical protein